MRATMVGCASAAAATYVAIKYVTPSLASAARKTAGAAARSVLRPRPGQAVDAAVVGCAAAAAATYVALAYALPPLASAARASASVAAHCVLGGLAAPAAAPAAVPAAASMTPNRNPQLSPQATARSPGFNNSSSIFPTGPCTALIARSTQGPQAVTWVACPRLALDLAAFQPSKVFHFSLPLGKPRPGHSLEQPKLPPARLALPGPVSQRTQLLRPPPPPPPPHSSSASAKALAPPTQGFESAAADAAPQALELALVPRRPMTVGLYLQPAQVLSRSVLWSFE